MNDNTIESTAIVVREGEGPAQPLAVAEPRSVRYSLPELKQLGEMMFASGMFKDLKSSQQAMVKLLAGAELGYGPFHSLNAFHVIEGKPAPTAGEISSRIKGSAKYDYKKWFIKADRTYHDPIADPSAEVFGCVIIVKERKDGAWEELEPVAFTLEDAKVAGLAGRDNWRKYTRDMLFARAITAAGRQHCADLFGGPVYTPEELTGYDETPPPPKVVPPKDDSADRERGRKAVSALCREKNISDETRHAEAEAMFGEPSMKNLSYADLRSLYKRLKDLA